MGRKARQKSQTGLYHIVFRGISRQNIFEEDSDYEKLKEIIQKVKDETNFEIYASAKGTVLLTRVPGMECQGDGSLDTRPGDVI